MSVDIESCRIKYAGSGIVGPYTFPFRIYDDDDLLVIKTDSAGTETVLVNDLDYTVSGVGDDGGGSVTLTDALSSSHQLTLIRAMDYLQTQEYASNAPFTATSINDALDKLEMQIQQLREASGRAIQFKKTSNLNDKHYPTPIPYYLLGWDGDGTEITQYPSTPVTITIPQIDHIGNYGGDLAEAVTTIGSGKRLLMINTGITVDDDLTVPANIELWVPVQGLITVASGKTLTIENLSAGNHQVFAGAGTVLLGAKTHHAFPEWWGAVADGDGGTDSGPAILAAITAAPDRMKISLMGEYYNAGTELPFGSTKFLQFLGPAKIFYGGTGKCISISAGTNAVREKHRFADLVIAASAGNERNGAGQNGIYLEDSTKCVFERVWVLDFMTNWKLWLESLWIENNTFINCKSDGGQIGWDLDGTGTNNSFATNTWIQCNVALSGAANGAIGVKIGENANIYRSYLGFQIHNKDLENGVAIYVDAAGGAGVQGHVDIEGDNSPGSIGWKIGPNATSINWNVYGDIRGISAGNDIVFEAGAPTIAGIGYFAGNNGKTTFMQDGEICYLGSVINEAGDYVYRPYITSANNFMQRVLSGKAVTVRTIEDDGVYGIHQAVHVCDADEITDAADTTPSVKGLGMVTLTPGGSSEVNYTNFDDGVPKQRLIVVANNGRVNIVHDTGKIRLSGSIPYAMVQHGTLELILDGTVWREVGRCVP
jgi:hypothetical protein